MYNYSNLNDVEFEDLCKDVMEKKLSIGLRLFAKGRDGGVDLTDNFSGHNIIIQVKHYIGSSFSNLRISLKKEIEKVQKLKPKQYYVCCGMHLTEGNIREIFEMFSDFMETHENIVTLKEIDEFLQKEENIDVVRRHYKLWLYASNILNEIYNQDIFIDCETLLSDIDDECKYFVKTRVYDQCIEHLDKSGLLMITGGPGVGKTITSKMLVLYYASQGYRVRYTTNGDISDIKKSLSSEGEVKEIVLLDDCLGQHYFNMKQTQEIELLSLIKYIKLTTNKKLILNSRITIFNEARERSLEFNRFFQEKKIKNYMINMDRITTLEKAKIFYNHLIFKGIPSLYYNNIKENKNYMSIVQHTNYTPRIIEHVTLEVNYQSINPAKYFEYISENLSNPRDIWKNEFDRRLQNVDRALLSTLYSLTDTSVEYGILRRCFNNRLSRMKDVDYTLDNFELVISRLNQSVINIIDYRGERHVGVINPSVNDYMKNIFANNEVELKEVRNAICNFIQIARCYSQDELKRVYINHIENEKINEIDFINQVEKSYFITSHVCEFKVMSNTYKEIIFSYLENSYCYIRVNNDWMSHIDILDSLLKDELYSFYTISEIIEDELYTSNLLQTLDLDELVPTINLLNQCYIRNRIDLEWFKPLCKDLFHDAIIDYVENIDTADYCDSYDIGALISENYEEEDMHYNMDAVVSALEDNISGDIDNEINEKLSMLDVDIKLNIKIPESYNISTRGIESAVNSYFRDDDYDDDRHYGNSRESSISEIEIIFER